ncbi:MAG: hypothetical protein IPM29_19765 [Planctomycetes bacterium]|nr:hypothetical protein [Planctomycetota bacterium]
MSGPRHRTALVALALGVLVATAPPAPAQRRPRFDAVLWRHGAEPWDEAFHSAARALGFTAVSATAAEAVAPARAVGLGFYTDQLAGKGVLELRDSQWQPWFDRYWQTRDPDLLVRPTCLADQAVIASMLGVIEARLAAALPAGPRFASLADEASATRHANPLDICGSDAFRTAFRDWLRARSGGDIAALDARWGTTCRSFDEVLPVTTAQIRGRELQLATLPGNLSPWSDQLEFTDELFAAAVGAGLAKARELAPELPCGLFGIPQPSAFGGHDFFRLLPAMSAYEVYDIGGARDLADCFAAPAALRVVTVFPPHDGDPEGLTRARVADAIAHGTDALIVWSAGDVLDAARRPSAFGRAVGDALGDLGRAAEAFAGARIVRDPIWIVESQPALRAHWMLDSAGDGRTWPRRFSSYEAEHGTPAQARRSWLRLFNDLGFQPRFVDARALPAELERGASAAPRLCVLAACLALDDAAVAALRAYAERGGVLLADHGPALYDGSLHLRERGALDDVFGITSRSLAWSDQLVRNARGADAHRLPSGVALAERGLRGLLGERTDGADLVQIEASCGRGRAFYLNLAACEYASLRLVPERVAAAAELRRRVRRVLDACGARPRALVRGPGLPTCLETLHLRGADGARLCAVRVAALDAPELLRTLAADGPRPVELRLPFRARAIDLRDGRELGTGDRLDLRLDPFGALLLRLEAPE